MLPSQNVRTDQSSPTEDIFRENFRTGSILKKIITEYYILIKIIFLLAVLRI